MRRSIVISGPPAVGKTTVARALADEFDMEHISGGDVLKDMAKSAGYDSGGADWWDTEPGIQFLKVRQADGSFDREVDQRLIQFLREGNKVITSYTLPWLVDDGIKIWLSGSHRSSAARMRVRDNMDLQEAMKITKQRFDANKIFYKKLYDIDFGDDLSVFHAKIDTDQMSAQSVIDTAGRAVRSWL